jgi:hypothetical protein
MRAMRRDGFQGFERLAQRLVEGSLGRLTGDRTQVVEVAAQLARAMEDSREDSSAPNYYRVTVNPSYLRQLEKQQPELTQRLCVYLRDLAQQSGLSISGEPRLEFFPDATLRRNELVIETHRERQAGETTNVFRQDGSSPLQQLKKLDAFLIINGRRHVALDKPLVTIGRRVDNDVIVDSPVVSRQHAHIRWRYGHFVLFDVGSRGGITVNGEPCRECVLHPGDLIALSDRIPLIYGEGLENRGELVAVNDHGQDTLALPGGALPGADES